MVLKMMKNFLVVAGLGLCLQASALAAEPGSVATISESEGTVMVDHGKGFVSSKAGESLFQNDRVITLDGSSAEVTFADGCRAKLKSNNMITISSDPGCKAAIVDATKTTPAVAGTHPAEYGVGILGAALTGYIVIQIISDEF